MTFSKLVYILLVCTVTTSGEQDETTVLSNAASTSGASVLSTQNYMSDGSLLGFPSVTSPQNGRKVSEQGAAGIAERTKPNTTEQESDEETGKNQRENITLPKTVVSVALVLLLTTSVLHCVFILHYCMKIWYCCCTQEVESNVDYSRMSVFGTGDLSNRSSLNKASINLRSKETELDAETAYQNYSYRCNSNYNDGFLNLDNAINKGRHSKRISFISENEQCRRQNQTRASINSPSEKDTVAEVHPERDDKSDKCSMIVPSIQVNSQEEQAKGIGTFSSDTESVENPSQISSDKCALPFNDQAMGSDNETATKSTIPINCPMNREDLGASLSQLNSTKKQLEKHMEEPSEVEKRKPGLSAEHQNSSVVNTSKRAVSAGDSMHLTEEHGMHKQQQLEARRFSSFELSSRENYQSTLKIPSYMNNAAGGNKRHYFLHCGGPETSV